MQNEKKTRFEVGMEVVVLIEGWATKATVTHIHLSGFAPVVAQYINEDGDYDRDDFTPDGYRNTQDHILSLYTLPEYEALQALTASFIDGTFGKEQNGYLAAAEATKKVAELFRKPKFEPQGHEKVLFNGLECLIIGIEKRSGLVVTPNGGFTYTLEMPSGLTTETNGSCLEPVIGYEYSNGFCLQQKDNPTAPPLDIPQHEGENIKPNPISGEWNETTDLLEDGKPVYFTKGMEVYDICFGRTGVVQPNTLGNSDVWVDWQDYGCDSYTFDGRMSSSHNQTLFPIEQYNQIQLPKLKPIQVPKPKADVIGLPSWFKGGVNISPQFISDYIWDSFNNESNVLETFGKFIGASGADGAPQCTFYFCMKDAVQGEIPNLSIRFTYDNRLYDARIDYINDKNTEFFRSYQSNGIDVSDYFEDGNWIELK